jgi:hypothetical protein
VKLSLGLIKPLQTEEEAKYKERGRNVGSEIKFIKVGRENVTALKSTMQCPLVLLIKVGWGQGRSLESEESKVMEGEIY